MCDLCGSDKYDVVYKPIGTRRNSRVCICQNCGLVFSIQDNVPHNYKPTPSGDADWGNIRFAKGQRLGAVKDMLLPYIKDAKHILDIGSSRGDFMRWARGQNPKAHIDAIEPDERVALDYINEFPVSINRLEDTKTASCFYDFVYCMQTLEHAESASAMLKQMCDCMKPGGILFLEVPNIEVIRYPLNVEEFFIDKHNFHFGRTPLYQKLTSVGFGCLDENKDDLNIRLLLEKRAPQYQKYAVPYDYIKGLIEDYAANIQRNRAKLPAVVEKINRLMRVMKVAFWGANTLFDLLVRYGGLDPQKVECLMDDYMTGNIDTVHGVPVLRSNYLRVYQPDVCIVLARFSTDAVVEKARRFGVRNVIKFSDLLEAV